MASESTAYPYRLPGGKAAVETRRTQLRTMLGGALLFGPSYLRLIHAARSGDRGRLHDAERSWAKRAARAVNLTIETHGMHLIDDGAMAYRAIIRAAERAFHQQESVVLFPQGSILGIETAFHQGAFRL
ncbi:MAG: hypothetical protein V3S38_02710, partial [Acidimicrobiia bacterium]